MDVGIKRLTVNGAHADYVFRLQELIAPREVLFFNSDFQLIGNKEELEDHVSEVTGISTDILSQGPQDLQFTSVAVRMRWTSRRTSTRPEDMAYSLLGIFDINMPLLYGEGEKAFHRLQVEIIRQSDDESIFAWQQSTWLDVVEIGLLARDASYFSEVIDYNSCSWVVEREHYEVTNKGVRIVCNVPNDLIKAFSNRQKGHAMLLMPLNVFENKDALPERQTCVPCLRFRAIRSFTESGRVKKLTGIRESVEVVTVPNLLYTRQIKEAAERFKNSAGHSWEAFCRDGDADHTAIPVYFPLSSE